jgi:hypothetical protein
VNGAHDRRVADCAVVHEHAVYCGDRVEQAPRLYFVDDTRMVLTRLRCLHVVVQDASVVAVAALQFGADDGRDLLRRPGRASSSREALGTGWDVVNFDDDRTGHDPSL